LVGASASACWARLWSKPPPTISIGWRPMAYRCAPPPPTSSLVHTRPQENARACTSLVNRGFLAYVSNAI